MNGRLWDRLAASCGALAVVLLIVGNEVQKIGGGSPGLHDSPQEYLSAVGRPGTLLVGGFLIVLASCLFVPFFASLAARLRRAAEEGDVLPAIVLGGGLVTVAVSLAAAAPVVAAGVMADDGQLSPELAKALSLMNGGLFVVMWATSAIYVGATAVLVLSTRALPRFLGWAGVLLAPGLLVGSLVIWKYEAAFLAWMLTLVWIIATSIAATIRAAKPEPSGRKAPISAPIEA